MTSEYNFTINQGADFALSCFYKDDQGAGIDLTGSVVRSQARRSFQDGVSFSFTVEIEDQTTDPGKFRLILSNETSSALDLSRFNVFIYDVEIETNGDVVRLFSGRITMSPEVTK
jgi:hypothetical protein